MERVRRYIHADYAYKMGLSGKNVTIAVMDTGIVPHPDLKDRIVLFRDFCQNRIGLYDDNGHGTHIAGILAGNGMQSILNKKGNYMGIAPKARLISLKVLDAKGNGSTQNMLEAVDYLLRIRERFHIRILNISVGMLPDAGKKEQRFLRLWKDYGTQELWSWRPQAITDQKKIQLPFREYLGKLSPLEAVTIRNRPH